MLTNSLNESRPNRAAFVVKTRSIASDVLTPIGAYQALSAPASSCLLESVEHGGKLSRYSFIGVDYIHAEAFEATPDLYDRMREAIAPYRPQGGNAPMGGALVVFTYDAARPMAHLKERTADEPAMPAAYAAIPATWLIFDHLMHTLTIWCMGENEKEIDKRIDDYIERLLNARASLPQPVRGIAPVTASMDRETYLNHVARIKQHIYDGDVYQLQIGIRFSATLEGGALDLYRALRRRNPSPYMFYVDTSYGQLLGASPEFLVRLDGRKARIRPLAGTRPRAATEREDEAVAAELLNNEKERAEHVMLVDLGRNDLGLVCSYGTVNVDELLQIEHYSHVMHIVSNVTGTLRDDRDGLDLLRAGFPAGTVTGTPKVRAMQIIDELEPVTRGFYAGSIGRWSFGGDFDSCITLRSIHVQNNRAYWQASAGIVADSDPVAEYEEVLHKTRIAREVLGVSV